MPNQITLSITGIADLVIEPITGSVRSPIDFLKSGDRTARGVATIQGVTARKSIFIWKIEARLLEWEYHRLRRIISTQQSLLATSPATAEITLKDEFERLNSFDFDKNGRSIVSGSALTEFGETTYYCNFKVKASIPENAGVQLNAWAGQLSRTSVTLIIEEF